MESVGNPWNPQIRWRIRESAYYGIRVSLPRFAWGRCLEVSFLCFCFPFRALSLRLRQTDRGAPFLGAVWCRECYGALSFCALRGHIGALDDDVKGEVAMQRVHEVVVAQRARVSRCDAS